MRPDNLQAVERDAWLGAQPLIAREVVVVYIEVPACCVVFGKVRFSFVNAGLQPTGKPTKFAFCMYADMRSRLHACAVLMGYSHEYLWCTSDTAQQRNNELCHMSM